MKWRRLLLAAGCILFVLSSTLSSVASAAPAPTNFNLQVTPSPLVATVNPGVQSQLQLRIYNNGASAENLKIQTRSFTFNSKTGRVNLNDNVPPTIGPWISFSAPTFTIQSGQWLNEEIRLDIPKTAGFNYSFALVISPQSQPQATSGRIINASLAVFALLNVNRPGATSSLKAVSFTSSRSVYQYLPATLSVRLRNTGNTILQPSGNIFIAREANTKTPLAALTINNSEGYILPGTTRTFSAQWSDGFATYQTAETAAGTSSQRFVVDWSKLSRFRIGRYTAQLVAVYNDDGSDVPIEDTVSFWVIPWLAILVLIIVIVALWYIAHWLGKRRTDKAVRRALAQLEANKKTDPS
jgi:hypothetical protein